VTHPRKGLVAIVLGFDEPLDSAGNGGFYNLTSGIKERHRLLFSKALKIDGVSYDGSAHTVTPKLARPTKGPVQVTIRGGILSADGSTSRGDFTTVVK
jgi:hypothetical protein